MRKGSKEAKAWGAKMRRLRGTKTRKKSTRRKTRRTTTRRRRTTRKGMLTLRRTKAYRPKKRRRGLLGQSSDSGWSW